MQSAKPSVKIIDFDLSEIIGPYEKISGCSGTLLYSAAEIIINKLYNCKINLWSLGLTLFSLLTGKWVFQNKEEDLSVTAMSIFEF